MTEGYESFIIRGNSKQMSEGINVKWWMRQVTLLLALWACSLILGTVPSDAQTVVGEFIVAEGKRLTLTFYPDRTVYELTPFNRPRYEILSNTQGEAQLLIRGFYTQTEEKQMVEIGVGPMVQLELLPEPRGVRLHVRSSHALVIEHTRQSIWFFAGSSVAQPDRIPQPEIPEPAQQDVPETVVAEPVVSEWLPGSHLSIYVFWEIGPFRRDKVVVDEDSTISYQELGRFPVEALSLAQVRQKIHQKLTRYLRHFDVTVHSREASGSIITVVGALQRAEAQGEYTWSPGLRVADLLDSLGGIHPDAASRIALYRMVDGKYERQWIDLGATPDLAGEGLKPSDVLYVPRRRRRAEIAVFGLVKRPGAQIVREGTTLSRALEVAGSTTATNPEALSISILRQDGETLEVAFKQLREQQDLPLKHGDVVYLRTRVP